MASDTERYLADARVTFGITSTGYQRDSDEWEHQVFPFSFTSATGESYAGTYRAGMAVDYPSSDGFPTAVDILSSIASDVMGYEGSSFEEWARDYGYSDDSIRALRIYEAIGAELDGMRQLFGPDTDRVLALALAESEGCNYA